MPFKDKLHTVKLEPSEPGYKTGDERKLTAQLKYQWDRRKLAFIALPGAINDGASIPSVIPDFVLDDHGKIDKPVVIHDDIYWAYRKATQEQRLKWEAIHGKWSKSETDLMFRDGCKDEGLHAVRCAIIYAGVQLNWKAKFLWGKNA